MLQGYRNDSNARDALQITFSSGNIADHALWQVPLTTLAPLCGVMGDRGVDPLRGDFADDERWM